MNVATHAALFQQAAQHLQRGDYAGAETLLFRLLALDANDPGALRMLGFLRYRQGRLEEAADALTCSLAMLPMQPDAQLNLAHVRRGQGMPREALAAIRAAIALKPDFAEAYSALGTVLQDSDQLVEAEQAYRRALALSPRHPQSKLGLCRVLVDTNRAGEVEALARGALAETSNPALIARLEEVRGVAFGLQHRLEDMLACYERAQGADPSYTALEDRRACLLADLGRFEEAIDLFRTLLAREPQNLKAHELYNNLLYCLGRDEEFLRSYDQAASDASDPTELLFAKAVFQMFGQAPQAQETYQRILARDPGNLDARIGEALALSHQRQFEPAMAIMQEVVARHPERTNLFGDIALLHAQLGEPQKGAAMAERGLAANRRDQFCLAMLGTCYRKMGDAREEWLHGYDSLIRVFDLEPPPGYSDMASFNAELDAYLDRLHPLQREFINQSLRGGTQTVNNIFGAGHELVEKLRLRIDQAVERYIAELPDDPSHPFTRWRANSFSYSGAWSSRLRNHGFHVNHVHPQGWISSCYYIAVPDVAADTRAREGWIKFGEPRFDVGLSDPIARAVQPVPGRLVLFPSYTWHGTIPFRDAAARTTIAFDVIPTA